VGQGAWGLMPKEGDGRGATGNRRQATCYRQNLTKLDFPTPVARSQPPMSKKDDGREA